jgi:hypothetical protein
VSGDQLSLHGSVIIVTGLQGYERDGDVKQLASGDFVDRGFYSVETFLLLLALKVGLLKLALEHESSSAEDCLFV